MKYKPFNDAEEVWFWFCRSMIARGGGLRKKSDYPGEPREIEVGDICRILKRMRLNHQVGNRELRVVTRWGCLGSSPYYDKRAKPSEIRAWDRTIKLLEGYLVDKGVLL